MYEDIKDNVINELLDYIDLIKIKMEENPTILMIVLGIIGILLLPLFLRIISIVIFIGIAYWFIMNFLVKK